MAIPHYRAQVIEAIARNVLCNLNPNYLALSPQAAPIEKLIEQIYKLTIEYKYLTQFGEELGKMVYDDGYVVCFNREKDDYELVSVKAGTMLIEATLTEDNKQYGRLRFTLAHELAHWLLHQKVFSGTGVAAASYNKEYDEDATEWQANYLAQAILMPKSQVNQCFYNIQNECLTRKERIEKMATVFEVSKQAMEIRLKSVNLIN